MTRNIPPHQGMFCHLIGQSRPDLVKTIAATGLVETIVCGLGSQGTRHAGLMAQYGTRVTAGIAPGRGGERLHETIPVYDSVAECLAEHPGICAASIWRHYSSAREAALEAITAGIPLVVLISEGIPLRDVRDILTAARRRGTVLIGGNTPGIIFPPEGLKIGMLPDVFYPEEPAPDRRGPGGVTIISRSGAILYHLSDGLASVGIAQNAVIGVGGDGAIGSTFRDLVPRAMAFGPTGLVVVAGEIGGAQEELLAEDIAAHPGHYPKPLVALLSGRHAPAGKTMGHAGAIVAPGRAYGTFETKRRALEAVGVTVVNSQPDLIAAVRGKLGGKTYFDIARYREKMRTAWEEPPKKPEWSTLITKVEPNRLTIAGYRLEDLIAQATLLETTHLLVKGERPAADVLSAPERLALDATRMAAPDLEPLPGEDISLWLARCFLNDTALRQFEARGASGPIRKTVFALGRSTRFLAAALGHGQVLDAMPDGVTFSRVLALAITGDAGVTPETTRLLEAMLVSCVDHGVTPPSAQATVLAASVRASYELAVASGIGAITDVHGGAGAKAAEFFRECVTRAAAGGLEADEAVVEVLTAAMRAGRRIEGLGHRVHTEDPRRAVLWRLAEETGFAGPCVAVSRQVEDLFAKVRGLRLPLNVDGVIGAIVGDLGLAAELAKAVFVLGRVAGLSAHYFEEVSAQLPMRRINFGEAVYRGPADRPWR
jgi:succinyl-CoA synthetase alpha subunit